MIKQVSIKSVETQCKAAICLISVISDALHFVQLIKPNENIHLLQNETDLSSELTFLKQTDQMSQP